MSEADIKLRIVCLIDSQRGEMLQELYEMIVSKVYQRDQNKEEKNLSTLELGYRAMAEDKEREEEAFDWIEGTDL